MTPQAPMYIGSQSKSFTGLAVAQLIEQGKIELNKPMQTYIPWSRVADAEASKRITISHLLNHTSGLSEAGFTVILPDDATNEEAVRTLGDITVLMLVGSVPDYVQGLIRLVWVLTGKTRHANV